MKNNRNTMGQQMKPSQKNLGSSVDRKTMTNPSINTQHQNQNQNQNQNQTQNQVQTQSRQANLQLNIEKMCEKINRALYKFGESGARSSINNTIQPKGSTLFNNISTFINAIDRNSEKFVVDTENIPAILNFWGYPHFYNKNIFQPIGAPHTWPSCLQMMEYLADISNFIWQYRATLEQYKLDDEEIDLILQGFENEDDSKISQYYQKQIEDLEKQEKQLQFKIQSSQLTLKNIKNSQKSLTEMEAQQSLLIQKLQREGQNVIEIDQQNSLLISQIQKIDDHAQQLQIEKASLEKKIQMMQQEINSQELGEDQATKLQSQIAQYDKMIVEAEEQFEAKKKQYEAEKEKITESFCKIVGQINQIKENIATYQDELQLRKFQMPIPQTDHVAFTQAIHTEDMNIFDQAVAKMLEIDKIKAMLISQQSLSDILEHEQKILDSKIAQIQGQNNYVDTQQVQAGGQIETLQNCQKQAQNQIIELQKKQAQYEQEMEALTLTYEELKQENLSVTKQQAEISEQIRKNKQHMAEGVNLLKKYDSDCEAIIAKMEAKEEEIRKKIQTVVERIQGGFTFLNQQLESYL